MSRRPALDGLRALAVLAVMAFHTSPAAHGGFTGVDIFFVVSGYLITALLLREWTLTGRVDLPTFYLKRALRLGPALLLMLLITTPLVFGLLRDSMGMPPWIAIGSVLLYVANWANVVVSAGTGPLTHTWSLSIEEQFYLIWPLLLFAVLRRSGRPPARMLAALIVVVVVARWICWDLSQADWIYYATTSHCDGLLIGSLLAVLLARRPVDAPVPNWSMPLAWAGLAGLMVMMATLRIDGGATYEYGLLLVAVFSAMVIQHLAIAGDGLLIRVLSVRPLVAIGVVSYGLYLYHFPVFKAVQHQNYPHLEQHGLEIGITVALTVFSWFVVEKPALRWKDRLNLARRRVGTAGARGSIGPKHRMPAVSPQASQLE
jgi:peptidoglycan/LPS O-acetylase OafA/YrhL